MERREISVLAYPAPRLISGPGFGTVTLINAVYGGVTSGAVALIPRCASSRDGIGALGSGTLLVAQGAAAVMFSIAVAFACGSRRGELDWQSLPAMQWRGHRIRRRSPLPR